MSIACRTVWYSSKLIKRNLAGSPHAFGANSVVSVVLYVTCVHIGPSTFRLPGGCNVLFHLGSDTPVGCPSIIPDIKDEYVKVKVVFVNVCTAQGTPTLDEVKDLCIDLIECVFRNVPQVSRHEYDIEKAKTLPELARVLCFRLSTWISYDFFKKVIAHFQPALKNVEEQLMHYEDQLKPLLQQKLESIAELQQR